MGVDNRVSYGYLSRPLATNPTKDSRVVLSSLCPSSGRLLALFAVNFPIGSTARVAAPSVLRIAPGSDPALALARSLRGDLPVPIDQFVRLATERGGELDQAVASGLSETSFVPGDARLRDAAETRQLTLRQPRGAAYASERMACVAHRCPYSEVSQYALV